MSRGPKKNFGDLFGILLTHQEFRLANKHHRLENEQNVCLSWGLFRHFFELSNNSNNFYPYYFNNILYITSVVFLEYFGTSWSISILSASILTKKYFSHFPIWNLPKCTVHSWHVFIFWIFEHAIRRSLIWLDWSKSNTITILIAELLKAQF